MAAIAEVAYHRNQLPRPRPICEASASPTGNTARAGSASFTEPYFLDQRIAAGFDIYHQTTLRNQYAYYENWTTGVTLRLGVPVTDEFTFQPHYSIYESQIIIPNNSLQPYNDCRRRPDRSAFRGGTGMPVVPDQFGEQLLDQRRGAGRNQAGGGAGQRSLTSLAGFSLIYNTIDNRKNPTTGSIVNLQAGRRRPRRQFEVRARDVRLRAITIRSPTISSASCACRADRSTPSAVSRWTSSTISISGPTLVRGFAPGGIGPRDISDPVNLAGQRSRRHDLFRRHRRGAVPDLRPAEGDRLEGGGCSPTLAHCSAITGRPISRTLLGLPCGRAPCVPTDVAPLYTQGSCISVDDERLIRSSAGGSLIWASPLGPIRVDFAYPDHQGQV